MASWRQTYWSVWTANLITAIGMMSFLPFFPSLLEEMGLEDRDSISTWSGVIFGAAPLAATVMSPVWGALGDRIGRRVMVVRAMLAIALFVGCMGFARTPVQLLVLRLGQGFFSGFIPPSITLVSLSAPPHRQGRVAGDLTTALALGAMVGPVLGGLIATLTSHRQVFLFVGAMALIAALLVACLAQEDASKRQGVGEKLALNAFLSGMMDDVREVFRNRNVRGAVLLVFFLQFGLGCTNPILELYVRDLVAAGEFESSVWARIAQAMPGMSAESAVGPVTLATSLLFAGMAVANLLALPLWGRWGDHLGHRRALSFCALGSALALFVQASAPLYVVLFLGRLLFGLALAGTGPLAFGLAAGEIAVEKRGGAFGVVFSARTLSVAVGAMAGGVLSTWIGIRALMVLSGAIVLVVLLVTRRK